MIKYLKSIIYVQLLVFSSLLFSCEKGSDVDKTIYVYKAKADYSKNVCVELSSDKTKITSNTCPGEGYNDCWFIKLEGGYLLNGTAGVNSGFLSITHEEYVQNYTGSPGADSLYKLLLDKDPFIEFYQFNDKHNVFYNENGHCGIDTAYLNYLILEDDLEKYFIRLK